MAQVNLKGAKVDATVGYTYQSGAPTNQVLCGNGTLFVPMPTCGTVVVPFYQTVQINGTPVAQAGTTNFAGGNFTGSTAGGVTTVNLASTITSTATNSLAVGGVALSGLCQTAGTNCPPSGITGVVASSGYIVYPNGLIFEWMPGPSVNEPGVSLNSGSWPLAFPHAIFGASCATQTFQGGPGSPAPTDIHVMEMNAFSTTGWTVRHSVGGIYESAAALTCFLTALGN